MGFFGKLLFGSDADDNFNEAEETNELAEYIVDEARDNFDAAKDRCEESLRSLDQKKQDIFSGSMILFAQNFSKIKNLDFKPSKGLKELEKYSASTDLFYPYLSTNTSFWESSWARTLGTAAVGYGFGLIGIGILRPYMKKKSQIALENANANYAEAELIVEQLEAATEVCTYIEARANMFVAALKKLETMFKPLVTEMAKTIQAKGSDYGKYSLQERKNIASAASMASSIKAVLDVAILTKEGSLTQESKDLCLEMAGQLSLPYDINSLGNTESMPSDDYTYSSSADDRDDYDFSSSYSPKSYHGNVESRVISIIVDKLGVDEDEVTLNASFEYDLGADSLDAVELIMEFEKEFGITIPDDQAEQISTVGDAISYIEANI